jgi:hypothetical protein
MLVHSSRRSPRLDLLSVFFLTSQHTLTCIIKIVVLVHEVFWKLKSRVFLVLANKPEPSVLGVYQAGPLMCMPSAPPLPFFIIYLRSLSTLSLCAKIFFLLFSLHIVASIRERPWKEAFYLWLVLLGNKGLLMKR